MLIDVMSGEIKPLEWIKGTTDLLESVPVRDNASRPLPMKVILIGMCYPKPRADLSSPLKTARCI